MLTKCFKSLRQPLYNSFGRGFCVTVEPKHYDVVISGGGPVGAALALNLARLGHFNTTDQKILLLDHPDAHELNDYKASSKNVPPEHKVFSVNPSSKAFLESLGVWELLEQKRIAPIKHLQIWEAAGSSYMRWNETSDEHLGYMVEKQHLLAALHHRIDQDGIVQRELQSKITRLNTENTTYASGSLDDTVNFTARLVVGCDDGDTQVHKAMKIPLVAKDTEHFAIACTVKTEGEKDTVWQRFLETGPIAILPCWDGYSSVFWRCDRELHKYLMELDENKFIEELNHNITKKAKIDTINLNLGGAEKFSSPPEILKLANERKSYPLRKIQSDRYVKHRLCLIGEAAHSVHPLAGQGLNLGLMDVEVLTQVLRDHLKEKKDIGEESLLKEFETKAKLYNYLMMGGIELIMKGYENELLPFVQTRNFALSALNNLGFAKKGFNELASGKLYRDTIVNSTNEEFWKGMNVFKGIIKGDTFPQLFGGKK